MMQFKAFKPEALNKIAGAMGYQGDMSQFQQFVEGDPQRKAQMDRYTNAARMMARGGAVMKFAPGGSVTAPAQSGFPPFSPATVSVGQTGSASPISTSAPAQSQFPPFTAGTVNVAGSSTPTATPAATASAPATPTAGQTGLIPQQGVPAQQFQPVTQPDGTTTQPDIKDVSAQMLQQPGLPVGTTTMAAQMVEQTGQAIDPVTGQLVGSFAVPTTTAQTAQAQALSPMQANVMQAAQAAPAVGAAVSATQAAQANPQDPRSQVVAAQQTATSVGNVQAAQGNAILMTNPVQRQIQQGELVSEAANAQTAAQYSEQIQAASATPTQQALVQGQLANLMTQFQGTTPPAWAAGAIRTANAQMAARGLGASSIAGQAIVQAAMESALPIAQADAGIISSFEQMNLSNRQQRAMLAAEQRARFMGQEFDQAFQARVQNSARIGDIANTNFTADQQIALENSRTANTMNLNNLSNRQALVMAEAAALANMDSSNLSNRQQAAVQNAQNFLQVDMTNLGNAQQTELFKAQQRVQSLFTDTAAENASRQFNATSQNQVDQFFNNLSTQVSQYNASQQNAQNQFNSGQVNAMEKFNAELENQRDQFNANNQLVIAQNNAQWRREIATSNTAAVNRANEINAAAVLDVSRDAYDNLWNYYADTMEWAWTSAEKQMDRYNSIAIEQLRADKEMKTADIGSKSSAGSALGSMVATLGAAAIKKGVFGF